MLNRENLLQKIDSLSKEDVREVEDFVAFMLSKKAAKKNPKEPQSGFLFGAAKNFFIVKEDFNEPLEDFKDYM